MTIATKSRHRRRRAVRHRAGRRQDCVRARLSGHDTRAGRRRSDESRRRRLHVGWPRATRAGRDLRVPRHPAVVGRRLDGRRIGLAVHAAARDGGDQRRVRRRGRAVVRVHHTLRSQARSPHLRPRDVDERTQPVRLAVGHHAHQPLRDGSAPAHGAIRHHHRATRGDRGLRATTPGSTPTPTTATPSRSTTCSRRA